MCETYSLELRLKSSLAETPGFAGDVEVKKLAGSKVLQVHQGT